MNFVLTVLFGVAVIVLGTLLTQSALGFDTASPVFWIVFFCWAVIGNVTALALLPDSKAKD